MAQLILIRRRVRLIVRDRKGRIIFNLSWHEIAKQLCDGQAYHEPLTDTQINEARKLGILGGTKII